MMSEETLRIHGKIEQVNEKMLDYLYELVDDLVVLFYEEQDRDADEIIGALENIDDELDTDKVFLVRCHEEGAGEQFGVLDLPALIYIQNGIPDAYDGDDLTNHAQILGWVEEESKSNKINDVTDALLDKLIEKMDNLVIVFYDMEDDPTVDNLEQIIANDCVEQDIGVVKINDAEEAKKYGFEEDMPKLIYMEKKVPSIFDGDVEDAQEVCGKEIVERNTVIFWSKADLYVKSSHYSKVKNDLS